MVHICAPRLVLVHWSPLAICLLVWHHLLIGVLPPVLVRLKSLFMSCMAFTYPFILSVLPNFLKVHISWLHACLHVPCCILTS